MKFKLNDLCVGEYPSQFKLKHYDDRLKKNMNLPGLKVSGHLQIFYPNQIHWLQKSILDYPTQFANNIDPVLPYKAK